MSAICRTPGSPPNTCSRCAACSPTSGKPIDRLVLAAGLAREWIEGDGVRVNAMPTLYGALSYSLRRLDDGALRFEISGAVAAKVVLRPPLQAPLRSVRVDGSRVHRLSTGIR